MQKATFIFQLFLHLLAMTSLLLAAANLVPVRTTRGMPLRAIKSVFQTLALFMTGLGALTALVAALIDIPLAALTGLAGALLSAYYIRQVSRPHRAFDLAFGTTWQDEISLKLSPEQHSSMLPNRWAWQMPIPLCEPCWESDIVYRTIPGADGEPSTQLMCDLWQPPAGVTPTGLGLIYVHGGGYFNGSKDFGTRAFFRHLAAQGHVIMDIDYRLAPRVGIWEMVDDVRHAVLWLKANAAAYGIDPERVVLSGGSAGGQLALLAAYAPFHPCLPPLGPALGSPAVRAVVSYYGVTDIAATYRKVKAFFANAPKWRAVPQTVIDRPLAGHAISLAARFREVDPDKMRASLLMDQVQLVRGPAETMSIVLGGTPDEAPDMYRLASPLTFAGPDCPPTLLFQGTGDYLVPFEPTRALYRALRAANVQAVYVEIPQTEHTFDLFLPRFSPPAQAALYDLDRFLALVK